MGKVEENLVRLVAIDQQEIVLLNQLLNYTYFKVVS